MASEFEELTDDEIEARQRAEDGEDLNADPGVGEPTEGGEAQAPAAGEGQPAAEDPAASAEPAAQPSAGGEADGVKPQKIEGVASKDGSRVLPYTALQAERRAARAAAARAERAEREAQELRQQIEDVRAGRVPESSEVTEEQVAQLEQEFPEHGKVARALFEKAKAASAAAPAAEPSDPAEPGDDPVQEAIDQVPLLLDWQHGDPEKFSRAQEIDAVLAKSPKWAAKPVADRFAHVAAMVADEYGIAQPEPDAKPSSPPAATPAPTAAAVRKDPETLSDFKGGSVADHGSIDARRMPAPALLARMQDMTDAEIDAHLAKYG